MKLVQGLKEHLPEGRNRVGVAAPASPTVIQTVEEARPEFWREMSNTLNEINVMSYDYHGAWDHGEISNFNSPLWFDPAQPGTVTGREGFNSQATVQAYKDVGGDLAKLNLGVPAYGRTYANVDTSGEMVGDSKGLYKLFNGVAITPNGDGTLQYSNIIADQGLFNWKIAQNYDAGQATAYSDSQNAFITFDNPASVANKAKFASDSGLHGLMLWDISGDVKVDDLNYNTLSLAHAAKSA